MASRAALVTGGSSGIGLAIGRALAEDGYDITLSGRRADKLEHAVETLRAGGFDVLGVPANSAEEAEIQGLVAAHRERFGRLDVLVNNAGVGVAAPFAETKTKALDLQLDVNLRGVYLTAREALPMLREAGAEHRKALIVNMASIAGKHGEGLLAAYSATKAGVVGMSQAMHKELSQEGIQVTAFCPGWVATAMTDWVEEHVPKDEMIQPGDIAEAVRYLLRTSPACIVPEVQFIRPGEQI